MATEADLMRTCAPLYAPIALESLASVLLFVCFCYLVVIIQSRGHLKTPGLAVLRFIWKAVHSAVGDVWGNLGQWSEMPAMQLKSRFALCRKLNTALCTLTACVSLLATTRWLHVGNVNGFRYLGYAFTCPVMQAELVMMIAPVVPCYKLNVVFSATITFVMLLSGYCASLMSGDLWIGSAEDFVESWDLDDLSPTTKFWVLVPSMIGICFLTFIQIPYLALLYTCRGGVSAGLPYRYRTLLLFVAISWWGFPVWWLLNWQGMSIIKDAKLNGAGFCLLNIISKGGFTLLFTSSSKWHKMQAVEMAEESKATSSRWSRASVDTGFTHVKSGAPWFVSHLLPFDYLDKKSQSNESFSIGAVVAAYSEEQAMEENWIATLSSSAVSDRVSSVHCVGKCLPAAKHALMAACIDDMCQALHSQSRLLERCMKLHNAVPEASSLGVEQVFVNLAKTIEASRATLKNSTLADDVPARASSKVSERGTGEPKRRVSFTATHIAGLQPLDSEESKLPTSSVCNTLAPMRFAL
jgi:hypothetical protein